MRLPHAYPSYNVNKARLPRALHHSCSLMYPLQILRVPTMQQQHGHLCLRSELLSIRRLLPCHVLVYVETCRPTNSKW